MSLSVLGFTNGLVSHAQVTGLFEQVNLHGSRSLPGRGLTAGIWFAGVRPARGRSGLASTSTVVTMMTRIYGSAFVEPFDEVEPALLTATDVMMAAYSGDFTLGGEVANIDLLGAHGQALEALSGWFEVANGLLRCVDITIPILSNDSWSQAA